MQKYGTTFWKTIPFLRLLLPLIAGILIRFYINISTDWLWLSFGTGVLLFALTRFIVISKRYFLSWISGLVTSLIFFVIGCFLVVEKDLKNDKNWMGKSYNKNDAVVVTIQEPLVEKEKSYKALATIESLVKHEKSIQVKGNILIYFSKDSSKPQTEYGSQILITKSLQPITNSGNPGGFDYKRHCSFQDIHYQVFLKPGDYSILNTTEKNWFSQLLINTREWVLGVLRKNISNKNEVSVAEALLIGYRDDLDRELVQSYSNTGVVHIIAISGLHLGMIYGVLVLLFKPFRRKKWNKFVKPLVILFVLWMFTFLAGAVPSISRSAVMFTFIVVGEAIGKRTKIYNTLAASAFLLLVWNPFYLWDVGFQLSFAAVLSIVAFSKHVNNWFYFQNKSLNWIWSLCSITLSAQILTIPLILYHFHQFPNLFLFTNILIVPLSGLILIAELALLIISFIPFLGVIIGKAVEWLIWIMNSIIERTDRIPFAVTDGILISIVQSMLLYAGIIFGGIWLLKKNKQMLFASCAAIILFFCLRSIDIIKTNNQQKLIVYNVPQHTAIDVVDGDKYSFIGDSVLQEDGFLRNFHLRPSRIVNRMDEGVISNVIISNNLVRSNDKRVLLLDHSLSPTGSSEKVKADVIVITKNPRLYMDELVKQYDCKLLVFDATNPLWKIQLWKKDCDSLHLRFHSIPEQGAFEMDL